MTALTTILALLPLLLAPEAPGTLLDTLLTPVMFSLWGQRPAERLVIGASAH